MKLKDKIWIGIISSIILLIIFISIKAFFNYYVWPIIFIVGLFGFIIFTKGEKMSWGTWLLTLIYAICFIFSFPALILGAIGVSNGEPLGLIFIAGGLIIIIGGLVLEERYKCWNEISKTYYDHWMWG